MTKGEAIRNFIVGLSFLGGLVIVGAITLELKGASFFREMKEFKVRFAQLDQLEKGAKVTVLGHKVGQVDSVELDFQTNPQTLLVTCSIDPEVVMGPNTTVSIRSAGPLGGRFLDIDPGKSAGEDSPEVLLGDAPGDLFAQLESLVSENEERISDILEGLREVVNDIRDGEGLANRLIKDKELADGAREIVENVRQATAALNEGDGLLRALLHDQETRDKATSFIDNIDEVSETLRGEEGTIGFLLNNEQAKSDLEAAIADIREITRMAREGDGVIATLLSDDELSQRLDEAVADIQEIANKINSGHGTLGQIINNRRAWDELVRILVQARETIEDLREQAPISTFTNALFAVF